MPDSDHHCVPRDSVDALLTSWDLVRRDLDFAPVSVIARLDRVRSHLDTELEQLYAAHGLSAASFSVLVTLARIGGERGVSQRRLMDELRLTSGTVSVRMDRLVAEGLVTREADPESRRTTLIALTPRGRDLFERVAPAHLANEQRLLTALGAEDRALLATLLRKLLVEFEGSVPPDTAPLRLGLTVAPAHVTIAAREAVGLPAAPGLLVRAVDEDGPGAAADLRVGDVLIRAGRRELRSIAALYAAIDEASDAERLRLRILRGVQEHTATPRLAPAGNGDGTGDDVAPAARAGGTARGEHRV